MMGFASSREESPSESDAHPDADGPAVALWLGGIGIAGASPGMWCRMIDSRTGVRGWWRRTEDCLDPGWRCESQYRRGSAAEPCGNLNNEFRRRGMYR